VLRQGFGRPLLAGRRNVSGVAAAMSGSLPKRPACRTARENTPSPTPLGAKRKDPWDENSVNGHGDGERQSQRHVHGRGTGTATPRRRTLPAARYCPARASLTPAPHAQTATRSEPRRRIARAPARSVLRAVVARRDEGPDGAMAGGLVAATLGPAQCALRGTSLAPGGQPRSKTRPLAMPPKGPGSSARNRPPREPLLAQAHPSMRQSSSRTVG